MRVAPIHFIFAASSADELIQEITEHLEDFLNDPTGATSTRLSTELKAQAAAQALAAGVAGLATSVTFVTRPGTGNVGDLEVREPAVVIFGDDDKPGRPYVRVIVESLGNASDWGDQVCQSLVFVVDAYADEWNGILTSGVDARDAGNVLASVVWQLLSPTRKTYPLLRTWGFTFPAATAGASFRDDVELHRPITFGTEIYYRP